VGTIGSKHQHPHSSSRPGTTPHSNIIIGLTTTTTTTTGSRWRWAPGCWSNGIMPYLLLYYLVGGEDIGENLFRNIIVPLSP
jgi:hypothetical protein